MAVNRAAVGTDIDITFGGTTIPDIYEINFPELNAPKIDATHYQSEEYREYIVGDLKELDEMSIVHAWDPGESIDLSDTPQTLIITFPDRGPHSHSGGSWSVQAYISGYSFDAPIEELMKRTIKFTLTGVITVS